MTDCRQAAERWYAQAYDKGHPLRRYSDQPSPWVVEFAASRYFPPQARVADIACGEGIDAAYLAARGCRVVGLDIAHSALQRASAIAAQRGLAIDYAVADMTRTGLADGAFDVALACACMGWLLENAARQAFVRELARVLRPGGWLLFTNGILLSEIAESFPEVHAQLAGREGFAAWREEERTGAWAWPSQRYDTRDGYHRLLESAGLRVIHSHLDVSPDAWGVVIWARKLA